VDVSPRPAILGPEESGNVWELLVPAFSGLADLDEYQNINNFDAHGTTGDTPRLIDAAHPYLELCRRAACRRDRTWRGPPQPGGVQAARAVRALSSKGLMLWRDGHDAEAAEWMVAALTVGYDGAALSGDWNLLITTEEWVLADLRDLLSEQTLTAAQLELLARRLELLRSVRLPFVHRIRQDWVVNAMTVLEDDIYISEEGSGSPSGRLSSLIGWKDFYSLRFAKSRLLTGLRSCERDLERVPWEDAPAASKEAERVIDTYRGRCVHPVLPYLPDFVAQERELLALDILAVAVDCARYQALHDRLPRTWRNRESRGPSSPAWRWGEGLLTLIGPGSRYNLGPDQVPREWRIGRRSGRK